MPTSDMWHTSDPLPCNMAMYSSGIEYKYGRRSDLRAPNFSGGACPQTPPSMCMLTHASSSVPPPVASTFHHLCSLFTSMPYIRSMKFSQHTSFDNQMPTPEKLFHENLFCIYTYRQYSDLLANYPRVITLLPKFSLPWWASSRISHVVWCSFNSVKLV